MYRYIILLISVFLTVSVVAQQKVSVSGVITDENNEPLIGASVYLNGTNYGVATNVRGEFIIKNVVAGKYQLYVSFTGFKKLRKEIDLTSGVSDLRLQMEETNGNLGEIVVSGTGTPHHIKTAPVPTELVGKKTIESAASPDFIDLMSSVSPSFDFSPGTMGSFIQLNGLGNDFITIYIDGKRVYGDMGGLNDLGRITPNDIERIEVVKGASSSLYGSDAIAGVINIITKKSKRNIELGNNTLYQSYNTLQQSNNFDFNAGRWSGHTSYSIKKSDGWQNSKYEIDDEELILTDAKTQNAYTNRTFNQDLSYKVNKKLSVNASFTHYNNNIENPLTVKKYGYFFEDFTYGAGAKYLISEHSNLSLDYNSDRYTYYYKYNQESGDYEDGDMTLQNDQQREDCNLKYINRLSDVQTLSLGAEYTNEIYRSDDRVENGKATAYTMAVYAQDEITILKALMLTVGIRVVNHKEFGTIATPKVSALYKLDHFNFRGTYSRGFKAPTLKELYYKYEKGTYLYLGNTDLDPQTSNYYSLGVDFNNTWLTLNLGVYQNDVNDLIDYETIETSEEDAANGIKTTKKHYNMEKARTKGADVNFDLQLPYHFTVGGGYSYVDARDLTADERLEYVAHNYLNLRAGYSLYCEDYKFHVQLLGRIQDEKYFEDGNAKGYTIWKLNTTHQFTHCKKFNVSATAGIDNIFDYVDDSPYGSHYGTINPGRTYLVGLNISFTK